MRSSGKTTLSETFSYLRRVKFADCDPAGIVYFPRFLEMANDLVEDWFDARLIPFKEFHFGRGWGVPLVNTKVDFLKACRLGETLHLELSVESLGRSSAVLAIRGSTKREERLRLRHKVAIVSLETRRAIAIPAELRERMEGFVSTPSARSPEPATHDGRTPGNAFRSRHLIRFSHCDPAGIVFYPRFFDLFSSALEDWFQSGIDSPFGGDFMVERNLRVPSLSITAEFVRPCRLGDFLDIDLWVARLGRSSFELALAGTVAGEPRLRAAWTMCVIDFATFKSAPIPDDLRQRMQSFAM